MLTSDGSFRASLWFDGALEPPLNRARPSGLLRVEVAVIGGGYTGLSVALHLAEAGRQIALFEGQQIGFGASGRNGGQVIPGLKLNPDDLIQRFGRETGEALVEAVAGNADLVFDLVERHGIRCRPERNGWVQAAHSELSFKTVKKRAEQWRRRGVPIEMLDAEEIAAKLGTRAYSGGWRDPRAGLVQPLDYARGLGRAAIAAGGAVFENAPVLSLQREGDVWVLKLDEAEIRADHVVIATNAYSSGLLPRLAESVLSVQSMLVATEPLPDSLLKDILPDRVCFSETRKIAYYVRLSPDNRLVIGGRGAVGPNLSIPLQRALIAGLHRRFPRTVDLKITHRWSGQLALTMDDLPHLHNPAPGLWSALGYNGRGIAMATLLGKMLAGRIAGEAQGLPISKLQSIFWHRWRRPIVNLGVRWYWLRDAMGIGA